MNDPGPSAARTALAYARDKDEMYVFQGGSYTPDQIQDLFRGLGSDTAILLDGGGSSAIVLRRDTGGMWAGAACREARATRWPCCAIPVSAPCRPGSGSTEIHRGPRGAGRQARGSSLLTRAVARTRR